MDPSTEQLSLSWSELLRVTLENGSLAIHFGPVTLLVIAAVLGL